MPAKPPDAGARAGARLTATDRATLRELRKASRKGAPFTHPGGWYHDELMALARKGLARRTVMGRTSYWMLTDAGRGALSGKEKP